MPVSTSPDDAERYHGDADHFNHVLSLLIGPAVESAGFEPLSPTATGADLIHAEIIRQLEISDLVLCDMTTLNPNVFFELGIRTAVDKPVCLIRDHLTVRIPFDTGILNTYTYDGSLAAWTLDSERSSLAKHVRLSFERSNNRNPLWRYFGLTSKGSLQTAEDSSLEEKVDFLLSELSSISAAFGRWSLENTAPSLAQAVLGHAPRTLEVALVLDALELLASEEDRQILKLRFGMDKNGRVRTLAEVAKILGLTEQAVRMREARAVGELREIVRSD